MVEFKKLNKNAAMSVNMIITVAGIVIAFAILVLFLVSFNWNPEIDKEVCYQSIVLRSSFNVGPLEAGKTTIPLKCETEKICLTMSGKDCEGLGEIDVKNRLDKDKEKAKDEIKETIANALYDCHSMVGKGMLDFMPHTTWTENYCLICSRIVLDEEVRNQVEELSYIELYSYMQQKETPEGINYLKAIYDVDGVGEMSQMLEVVRNEINERNTGIKIENIQDLKIDLSNKKGQAIIVQISPKGTWDTWLKAGTAGVATGAVIAGVIAAPFTAGASLTITGVGAIVLGGVGTGLAVTGVVYTKTFPDGKNRYVYPTIYPYNIDSLQELKCSSFETAP